MDVARNISLSLLLSPISSGIGSNNGFKTVSSYLQTPLQMDESGSQSSDSDPLITTVEDDGKVFGGTCDGQVGDVGKNTQESDPTVVRSGEDTIPARVASGIIDHANTGSKPSNELPKTATNAVEFKDIKNAIDISDTIAGIAASSEVRSGRKKRDRTQSSATPQDTATPLNKLAQITTYQPTIVTSSMSNYYVPPTLQFGSGPQKIDFTKNRGNVKSFAGSSKNKMSVHMLNSVGLECSDDGALRLHHFDDDDSASVYPNDIGKSCPIKIENETGEDASSTLKKKQKQSIWTLDQHKAFAAAIFEIGLKNCSPSIIMENMRKQPRYITRERTKSHLQKYRQTKERSKGEFLKEFNAFFKSIEQAKNLLNEKNSSALIKNKTISPDENFKRKDPVPKAILTTALEGKKPSKLLGGKAAALLSYSVMNRFSTSHAPDQLQYKAAKLSEFPSLTEEEKRSSVGASLLQVKSLIENMTDVLLKTRHGIRPLPAQRSGIGDDESLLSSGCSSDDGYSDEDEDNIKGVGAVNKTPTGNAAGKDQNLMVPPIAVAKHGGSFAIGNVPVGPTYPLYRGPPTAYPAPFPVQGAPQPVAAGFPPQQYPPAQPSFYGGALSPPFQPAPAPGFGGAPGFHHPQVHYPQDPRINPYQQAPPAHVGSYPGVPSMQPNVYSGVPSYPPYYGSTSESHLLSVPRSAATEYPHPGNAFATQPGYGNHEHRQRAGGEKYQQGTNVYEEKPLSYSNEGRSRSDYDVHESLTERKRRRRAEKKSKNRRRSSDSSKRPAEIDTSELKRSDEDDDSDFLSRISQIPSPSKSSLKSHSPIQRSRHDGGYNSSTLQAGITPIDKSQFDTGAHSNSYLNIYRSNEEGRYSEGSGRSFANGYEASPASSERNQSQVHADQHQHGRNNEGQFWEPLNNQHQPQSVEERGVNQQVEQNMAFVSETEQHKGHSAFGGVEDPRQANSAYPKSSQPSSATSYFFGE